MIWPQKKKMDIFTWKSQGEYMDPHNQAYWPTNWWKKRLEKQGYYELPHTPGLSRHETRQILFTLVVDGFDIKYVGEENAKHLLGVLKNYTKWKRIGTEVYTVESPSTGTKKNNT